MYTALPQIIKIAIAEDQLIFRQCIRTALNEMNDSNFTFQLLLEATDGNELLAGLKTIAAPDICTVVERKIATKILNEKKN